MRRCSMLEKCCPSLVHAIDPQPMMLQASAFFQDVRNIRSASTPQRYVERLRQVANNNALETVGGHGSAEHSLSLDLDTGAAYHVTLHCML